MSSPTSSSLVVSASLKLSLPVSNVLRDTDSLFVEVVVVVAVVSWSPPFFELHSSEPLLPLLLVLLVLHDPFSSMKLPDVVLSKLDVVASDGIHSDDDDFFDFSLSPET